MILALIRAGMALAAVAFLGLAVYVALLGSRLFGGMSILFYRGLLLDGLIGILIIGIALCWRWRGRRLDPALALAAAAVSFSVNLTYLIVIPVTIDRSISVFLLSAISDEPQQLNIAGLQQVFVDRYVHDMGQIERRVAEQMASGNIQLIDGKIALTVQGRAFLEFARGQSRLIGTDPRFVGLPAESPPGMSGERP